MIPLLLIVIAAVSYFLGSLSSPLLLAQFVFHKNIRRRGKTVTLASFVKAFGTKWGAAAVAIDIVKSVIAVLIGALLMGIPGEGFPVIGKLFAGFCLVLGEVFPVQREFRGGRGVIPLLVALWLTDWRIGILAIGVFVAVLALSQYMSLSSLCACFVGVIGTWIFVDAEQLKGLSGVLVLFSFLVILWRHRGNIEKLIGGKEPKINWGKRTETLLRDDQF